jgi:hypothetical protein
MRLMGCGYGFRKGSFQIHSPLSMIEEVQAKANKFPLKSEFPKKSPD